MKKLFTTILLSGFIMPCLAQWMPSGNNAYFNLSGNVGIGTTGPVYKLDLVKFSSGSALNLTGQALGTRNDAGIDFSAHNSVTVNYAKIGLQISTGTTGSETGGLAFSTINGGTLAEKMFIAGSGNVGIGTITPSYKFVVSNVGANGFEVDPTAVSGGQTNLVSYNRTTGAYTPLTLSAGNIALLQGNVSIGTNDSKGYMLAVNGSAIATSMTVKLNANWPDYVFKPDYKLPELNDVKNYIDQHQHLPDLPSAKDISENGQDLGEINKVLVKKVEELMIYIIEQKKRTEKQEKRLAQLEKRIYAISRNKIKN